MKKLILLAIICTLISGCGLFRKTTKIDKSSVSISASNDIQVSTDLKVDKVEKSTDNTITSNHSDEQLKIFPKPGTDVKIGQDGSIILQADSIISNTKKKTAKANFLTNQITINLKKNVDSLATKNITRMENSVMKDIVKEPSAKGIFSNWLGWCIVIISLLFFILWYFRIKR